MSEEKRRRNISWRAYIDRLAVRLAAERGLEDGVSELLEKLVLEEKENPRLSLEEPTPGYKAHISQSEAASDAMLKKDRQSKKEGLDKGKK